VSNTLGKEKQITPANKNAGVSVWNHKYKTVVKVTNIQYINQIRIIEPENEDPIFRCGERSYGLLHIDGDEKKQVLARPRSATGYRKLTRASIQSEGDRLLSHAHISFPQKARKSVEDISERRGV